MHNHADYLKRLTTYRKSTPSPLRADALAKEPVPPGAEAQANREDLLEGARENDRIIQFMIKRYSDHSKDAQP